MTRPNVVIPLPKPLTSATYDEANRQLTFQSTDGTKNITYDDNGNTTSITDACGTSTYTWNVRNQLTGIAGFKPDCTALTASFKYDALGRRIKKTIDSKTTNYLYDGSNIVQELEGGSVTANYVGTGGIDEHLARIKTDGTIRYYQRDGLGNIIALTDNAGAIKTQYVYDPFGNTTATGEASDNPFQYTGREKDETGLYYYRARYYNPALQRFISEDPIGLAGGDVNLYGYVQNNPINRIDPLGLAGIPTGLIMDPGEIPYPYPQNHTNYTTVTESELEAVREFATRTAEFLSELAWTLLSKGPKRLLEFPEIDMIKPRAAEACPIKK